MDIGFLIAVISILVAIGSAVFAWQAARAADKTFKAELIASIYEKYHSPEARQDHKKVWEIYNQLWMEYCDDKQEAKLRTARGEPIASDMALAILKKMEKKPKDYIAVDNMFGLWTYIMLLVFQGALKINQLSAFATPRILGLLYPIDEAKASHYGYSAHPKLSLRKLYEFWKKKYPESF